MLAPPTRCHGACHQVAPGMRIWLLLWPTFTARTNCSSIGSVQPSWPSPWPRLLTDLGSDVALHLLLER